MLGLRHHSVTIFFTRLRRIPMVSCPLLLNELFHTHKQLLQVLTLCLTSGTEILGYGQTPGTGTVFSVLTSPSTDGRVNELSASATLQVYPAITILPKRLVLPWDEVSALKYVSFSMNPLEKNEPDLIRRTRLLMSIIIRFVIKQ